MGLQLFEQRAHLKVLEQRAHLQVVVIEQRARR